ncbi:hypothetical protein TNCT_282741 [Trichonephila clavata]|uniref:Uncharacterized protein n=1 Tax=Trichonephila clavata TaxID=2740835 RepID=A0A8X6FB93_TRICU|nr:hypothetical protein TNCT_282741 [Trichonephila clavata]
MIKTHRFPQLSLIENSLENHPQHRQQKQKPPYKPITLILKQRGKQRQPPSHPSVIIRVFFSSVSRSRIHCLSNGVVIRPPYPLP